MAFNPEGLVWKRGPDVSENEEVWDDTALVEAYDRAISEVKEKIANKNKTSSKISTKKKCGKSKQNTKSNWEVGNFCQSLYSEDGNYYEACIKSIDSEHKTCVVHYVGYGNEEEVNLNSLLPSLGKKARHRQLAESKKYQNGDINLQSEDTYSDNSEATSHKNHSSKYNRHSLDNFKLPQRQPLHRPQSPWFSPAVPPAFPSNSGPLNHMPPFPCPPWSSIGMCPPSLGTSAPKLPPFPPPLPLPIDEGPTNDEEALASMLMSWYMSGYHTGYYQALKHSRTQQDNSQKLSNSCCHGTR